ncbi:MAG: pyridoxal-phosphate dependent enzyme [Planctomycetota bacterium]
MLQIQKNSIAAFYDRLHEEVRLAEKLVYRLDEKTPLEKLSDGLFAKREDRSKIRSYKWRGAFFKLHRLLDEGYHGPFIAASAGNHAQGVALAAAHLGVQATIFMPTTTPKVKVQSVRKFGGKSVEVRLSGDSYDAAAQQAQSMANKLGGCMIKPFDDLSIIAGQATIGLELFSQCPDLERLFVPIGGGGMASGVAFAAKKILRHPCRIIGVEVEQQNGMQLSIKCGQPIAIERPDLFCDGTAVQKPGSYTFEICNDLLDDIVSVTNEQVSAAMREAWNQYRMLPEPSGAIGLSAAFSSQQNSDDLKSAVIISGGNIDFQTLPRVVRMANTTKNERRFFRFTIQERNGSLIDLLDVFSKDLNIVDFQYGKTDSDMAHPILGIEGPTEQINALLQNPDLQSTDVNETSGNALSEFRVIPFRPDLCQSAIFLKVDIPNRPGALRDMMRQISHTTNICYFNFMESGELEGHALIGFELLNVKSEYLIRKALFELGLKFQIAQS